MSKPVVTLSVYSSIKEAMQIIQFKNICRLIVIKKDENDSIVRIITDKDIIQSNYEKSKFDRAFLGTNCLYITNQYMISLANIGLEISYKEGK